MRLQFREQDLPAVASNLPCNATEDHTFMSRNINVNPAHYKVAGRERQGEGILQQQQKQAYATQQAGGMSDGVPPWEATRHSFVSAQPPEPAPAKKVRKPKAKRA